MLMQPHVSTAGHRRHAKRSEWYDLLMETSMRDLDLMRETAGSLFTETANALAETDSDDGVSFSEVDDLWDDYNVGDDGDMQLSLVLHGRDGTGVEGTWAVHGWQLSDFVGFMLGSESTADPQDLFQPVAVDPRECGATLS